MEIGSSSPSGIGPIDVSNEVIRQVIICLGVPDKEGQEKQRNDSHDVGQLESKLTLKKRKRNFKRIENKILKTKKILTKTKKKQEIWGKNMEQQLGLITFFSSINQQNF